eukprot:TRINITY_DN208_c0_g1_i4.p1 TRINITY_DN208_c0_g1~~TRINITY_DN208_c0_g1_i4.p1  ORF type:complete len:250 (-),score=81.14 TRINITY_DN208_c0_g1_i4:637-1386(-)
MRSPATTACSSCEPTPFHNAINIVSQSVLTAIQAEAYLRLTGTPFTIKHTGDMGPYGKLPFIELNGAQYADSSTIIDVINAHFNNDLNKGLSPEQKAAAHALHRLAEESIYFAMLYSRWEDDGGWAGAMPAYIGRDAGFATRFMTNWVMRPKIRKCCWGQGTGRLPPDVVIDRFAKDLAAINTFLGDKTYLFDTAAPTYADVVIFSQLDCIFNCHIKTILDGTIAKFPALTAYVARINDLLSARGAPAS